MNIQLAGLNFTAYSPSQYELVHGCATGDRVFVWFNGSKWAVVYHHSLGHQVRRWFDNRDDAVAWLACVDAKARAQA